MKLIETQRKDIERLTEMMKEAFSKDKEMDNKEILLSLYYVENFVLWNIVENDKLIGVVCVKVEDNEGLIELLFIDSLYQKKGYGKHALNLLFSLYSDIKNWHVMVSKDRRYVEEFYKKLGFKEKIIKEDSIHMVK